MSKQKSLIRLEGTLGGIAFYKSGGEDLARMANGPSKSKIEHDPAFVRTRENNREFGGAAVAGKAFRSVFAEAVRGAGDRYLTARLTQLFKRICLLGAGARGQRSITPSAHHELLEGLEFNRHQPLTSIFNAPFTVTASAARNEASIAIADTAPALYMAPPAGASHYRLTLVMGSLADFVYDDSTRSYVPFDASQSGLSASAVSALLPLQTAGPNPVDLTVAFAGAPTLTADVSVIVCLGIAFYQEVNGTPYPLAQGNAMQVVAVI